MQPFARGLGLVTKGETTIEPSGKTITESSDLYDVVWGAGIFQDVHPILAYRLAMKSDVLGTAVHRIATQIAGFTLGLTIDGSDFETDSPAVTFLSTGSEGYSKRRFFYEIAYSFLLTNEAWVVLRGRPESEPVARTWVYPFDVINDNSRSDGLPLTFRTVGDRDRRTYRRTESNGRIRWLSEDGLNELVPILGAEAIDRPYRGQSPLGSLLYSVQQNVEGKRHNTSVLKNGLRLTGGVMPLEGERFEDAAVNQIRAAFQALRGSATAGGTLVMPRPVQALDLAISNREMDYVELLKEAKEAVYTFYGIPLPMVSNDASTFNNYATAQTAFFDQGVFPVFDDIADALTLGLEPRYPELLEADITYNESTIKTLKGRNLERMKRARDTQSMTTNEIRAIGGFDEVDGGDDILAPSTLLPIGDSDLMEPPEPRIDDVPDDGAGATDGLDDGE
jgi:HK97 family phage portal protein